MCSLKNVFRRIKYGVRYNSDSYINYLKKLGVTIGERTTIFDPKRQLLTKLDLG